MFIWGQWRVVIKGPENASKILQGQRLKEGWPWTPPVTLLGKSSLCFLEEHDQEQADELKRLIGRPLSQKSVVAFAPAFAEIAEHSLDQILKGEFSHHPAKNTTGGQHFEMSHSSGLAAGDDDSAESDCFKIKWEALRSYTLDIMDGPLWNMNLWQKNSATAEAAAAEVPVQLSEQTHGQSTKEGAKNATTTRQVRFQQQDDRIVRDNKSARKKVPSRERMLMWMERIKRGIDVIKMTFGPEWMYIWIFNEYGRALMARKYVDKLVSKHVAQQEAMVPVSHKRGHKFHDPSTKTIPLLALRDNLARSREGIFGEPLDGPTWHVPARSRAYTLPSELPHWTANDDDDDDDSADSENAAFVRPTPLDGPVASAYVTPFHTEQDLARPKYEQSPGPRSPVSKKKVLVESSQHTLQQLKPPVESLESPSTRQMRKELNAAAAVKVDANKFPAVPPMITTNEVPVRTRVPPPPMTPKRSPASTRPPAIRHTQHHHPPVMSLLERLLRQQGPNNKGISQTIMTELCITLWMMMDVGNAWTVMALHLLSTDREACQLVQSELDDLEDEFGGDLFSKQALGRMNYLDALLYESIRLTPPFLGGLKSTTETVELEDAGVQVSKGSHIFFCQATDVKFDIHKALGQRPEMLGSLYPCVEL